jgi:YHS domain-containing protein
MKTRGTMVGATLLGCLALVLAAPPARAGGDGKGAKEDAEKGAKQGAEKLKPQTTCPVMGGAINKDLYVDAKGKRIYVCCKGCLETVREDPAAALKTLEERGEKAAPAPSAQQTCPVMGGPVNKDLYVEHKGEKLYVCCQACLKTVKENPEKYAKKIAKQVEERSSAAAAGKEAGAAADSATDKAGKAMKNAAGKAKE